jgi:hypothetical protein
MSNFHKLLNRAYREIITEQDQPPVPLEQEGVPATPDQSAPTPVPEEQPKENQGEKDILSPEGMVFLVRLLPKALMIDTLDTSEQAMLSDIGDIDEVNAKDVLKKIIPLIQKYAPSSEKLPKV